MSAPIQKPSPQGLRWSDAIKNINWKALVIGNWPILAITFVALFLRFWGLDFGLPHPLVRPDEKHVLHTALVTLRSGSPGNFDYPAAFGNLIAAGLAGYYALGRLGHFSSADDFVGEWYVDPTNFYLIARGLSALAGTLTVPLLYAFTARLLGRREALLASAALAVAYLHVRDSHYATTDITLTFTCLLALVLIERARRVATNGAVFLAAVGVGFAVSTKYNAAPLVVSFAVALGLIVAQKERSTWVKTAATLGALSVPGGVLGFLIGTPFVLWQFPQFWHDFFALASDKLGGNPHAGIYAGRGAWRHFYPNLWYGVGAPVLLAAVAGIPLALRERRWALLPSLVFLFAYWTQMATSYVVMARYTLPILPLVCLFAALTGVRLIDWLSAYLPKKAVAIAVPVAFLALPTINSVRVDWLITREDSRNLLGKWIESNIPAGAVIGFWGDQALHPVLVSTPEQIDGARREFVAKNGGEGKGMLALEKFARQSSRPNYTLVSSEGTDWKQAGWFDWYTSQPLDITPDFVVVPDYPVFEPYLRAGVNEQLKSSLERDYRLIESSRTWLTEDLVFDLQDLFLLPYSGLFGVERPGPGFRVFKRVTE